MIVDTRDAKFRPGGLAGPKIQARPRFLRSPDWERWAYAGLEEGDHNVLCTGCWASSGGCLKDAGRVRCWALRISCGAGLGSGLALGEIFAPLVPYDFLPSSTNKNTFRPKV